AASCQWYSGKDFRSKVIERLHDTCARHEIGEDLARNATLEIDRLEQRRLDRIVGVDDDAPVPVWKARQRCWQFRPIDRDEDDVGAGGFLARPGLDRGAELAGQLFERVWAAAIRDGRLDTGTGQRPSEGCADGARSDDTDGHL